MMKLNDNIRLNAKSVRFTQPRQGLTLGPSSLTESPKQPTIRLKPGGDPVSQYKIQMIGYFANLFGLGFNFVGTFLLLKYSPESKTTDGWTVTADFEKELTPHLRLLPKKFTVLLFFCLSALPFNFWRRSCCNSSERPSL